MKLSSINRLINSVWVKKEVKVGDIIKYSFTINTYYCRVNEIKNDCCFGHYVKDLKDVDLIKNLNDGCVPIKYVMVLK